MSLQSPKACPTVRDTRDLDNRLIANLADLMFPVYFAASVLIDGQPQIVG